MTKRTQIILLTILTLCEIGSFYLSPYSVLVSTLIYVLSGLGLCAIALLKVDNSVPSKSYFDQGYNVTAWLIYTGFILVLINWIVNIFRMHIDTTPFDVKMADMLLFLREMARRYIGHKHVYSPISDIYGSPAHAVYLPAFWLPMTIPMRAGADLRWALLTALVTAASVTGLIRLRVFHIWYLLLLLPLALFIYLLLGGAAYYLMFTQEALVLAYVALLCIALIYEGWVLAGIAAGLCIMSRYFIAAPLLGGIIWLYATNAHSARKTIISAVITLAMILTVSGTWGDISFFLKIPLLYTRLLSESASFDSLENIYYRSVGFAALIRSGSVPLLAGINIAILFIAPAAFYISAHRFLTGRGPGLIILCGLKVFLILFLTTLSRPYGYVLYTASLVSIFILRSELTSMTTAKTRNL